ncbi:hypothetical protein T4B_875, partial [Trichinella pseudospiralis]
LPEQHFYDVSVACKTTLESILLRKKSSQHGLGLHIGVYVDQVFTYRQVKYRTGCGSLSFFLIVLSAYVTLGET